MHIELRYRERCVGNHCRQRGDLLRAPRRAIILTLSHELSQQCCSSRLARREAFVSKEEPHGGETLFKKKVSDGECSLRLLGVGC